MSSTVAEESWQALVRVAVGFVLLPAFAWLSGGNEQSALLWAFFLAVLLALRIVPVVIRHLIPFSKETQTRWFKLRALAKQYDSYQWRKLFWIGLGVVAYLALTGGISHGPVLLGLTCLLTGMLGEWRWRRAVRTDAVLQSALSS
jgi:hypothetical protein